MASQDDDEEIVRESLSDMDPGNYPKWKPSNANQYCVSFFDVFTNIFCFVIEARANRIWKVYFFIWDKIYFLENMKIMEWFWNALTY